ncbi:MAG: carbohydrate ABC transporter substrate-binding protein [Hyphomicrobiales bacterium]|nr:carbohydrate ABC transporter substrate-binding protein [Alphaproteobacteria bacterium]MCP4998475.1 carbohydrate ABC transporter substrate-binding protein [Hyphomicrobiales bacterium]
MKSLFFAGVAAIALTAGAANAELLFKPGEGPFNWGSYDTYATAHDYSGQTLSMTGPWTGEDDKLVRNVLAYFEEATGAKVDYSGSDSFEQDIVISAQANSAPNIAVFPQPGLAADMAGRGFLSPLGADAAGWVSDNYAAGLSWVDLGSYKGADGNEQFFAFPYKIDVKSLVWYVPEQFEENGYEVPESMEELKELTDQIVADGGTPWCIGLGSGAATGWPATDWVEDMLLRTQPPEVYDQWVTNEIPFDDPRIVGAIEEFGHFAKNDDYVAGGMEAVPNTDFRDSPGGLFELPPKCYMHHQATFIPTFFPEGTELGTDVDFFYFPAYESKDLGKPVLGAGTLFGILDDTPIARGFIEFLQTPIAHEVWMAQGGFLTPHKGVSRDAYANETLRALGDILLNATTFRFDGSDLMPGEIGAGAFWTGMVDYTSGAEAGDVAKSVQERWNSMQ